MSEKVVVAWGVFTKGGRLRNHIYRRRKDAKTDSIPSFGDKIRKVWITVRGS